MDLRNLKYEIEKNKTKYSTIGAVVLLIISIICVFKVFGIKLDYIVGSKDSVSLKTVLAESIIGGNIDGEINIYDIEKGVVLDTHKLDGIFLYSKSDDMKCMNAYDINSSKLYKVSVKDKKIKLSKKIDIDVSRKNILSFKYEDNYFIGLLDGGKQLVYKDMNTKKESLINLKLNKSISDYDILNDNLVLTSGDFIYSVDLNTLKHKKIDIGESSLSVHVLKNKLFIHNNFGADRGKSILLEVNPKTLKINNLVEFKESRVDVFETASNSEMLYYSERFLSQSQKEDEITQVLKMIDKEMKKTTHLIKHTSSVVLNSENSYGNLGYIYSRENNKLNIFNLKSLDIECAFTVKDDYYMPIY